MALALFNILERQGDVQGIKEGRRKRESESPWGVGGTLMLMEVTPGMIFFDRFLQVVTVYGDYSKSHL